MFGAGRYVITDLKITLHSKNTVHTTEEELKCITVFTIRSTEN